MFKNQIPVLFWNKTRNKFVVFYASFDYGHADTEWMTDDRLPKGDEIYEAGIDVCKEEDTKEFDTEQEALQWIARRVANDLPLFQYLMDIKNLLESKEGETLLATPCDCGCPSGMAAKSRTAAYILNRLRHIRADEEKEDHN